MNTYNITYSTKSPVTIWYNGHGVVPSRTIAYRTVRVMQTIETARYGTITYAKSRVIVKSTRVNACSQWGQWEVVRMIDLFAYLRDNTKTL